jgi:MFS family permease
MTYAALLFSLALYLQEGLGKSPLYSGSILLAWVIAFGSSGPLTSVVVRRLGRRTAPSAFLLLAGCFAILVASTSLLGTAQDMPLVVALALGGFGMGVGLTVLASDLTQAVTSEESGQLSGVMSTNSEVAATAGVALLGTLYLATLEAVRQPTAALFAVTAASGVLAVIAAFSAHRSTITAVADSGPLPQTR